MQTGDRLTLDVEKAVAGGWMLARHGGRVVLVFGAVPGERVRAEVTRTAKGVAYADVEEVLTPSPDRRAVAADIRCGGSVLAHVTPQRQRELKADIVEDALARLGRLPGRRPPVVASPEEGYRMRARFHARDGRLGFYREGSHQLCDAAATGQLGPGARAWLAAAAAALPALGAGVRGVEMAETIDGASRACHLDLAGGTDPRPLAALAAATGLAGLSASVADAPGVSVLAGSPVLTDTLAVGDGAARLRLSRNVRAFFQGNRYLLEPLVAHVAARVPDGPVVDLYAGVGLFGLALAARGAPAVTLVEGDAVGGADLETNAGTFGGAVRVHRRSVEAFLASAGAAPDAAVILDPPRTGLSKEALDGVLALAPRAIVYVSCDAATLARDTRRLVAGGYGLDELTVFDLFPNTAHVETVACFRRRAA